MSVSSIFITVRLKSHWNWCWVPLKITHWLQSQVFRKPWDFFFFFNGLPPLDSSFLLFPTNKGTRNLGGVWTESWESPAIVLLHLLGFLEYSKYNIFKNLARAAHPICRGHTSSSSRNAVVFLWKPLAKSLWVWRMRSWGVDWHGEEK